MNFKKLSPLFFVMLLAGQAWSMDPSKEITADDIFKKQVFSERSVHGLRSMNDGSHYTVLTGSSILK